MSLIKIRKRALLVETTYYEGGPAPARPLRLAAACAVIAGAKHRPVAKLCPGGLRCASEARRSTGFAGSALARIVA